MKKLTLNNGKAMACLILMYLFLAQSCKKDLLQPNSPILKNTLSFADARQYFDANLKQLSKSKKMMGTPDGTGGAETLKIEDILYNKSPLWDKAYQKLISTGTSVKIPIDLGNIRKVVDEQSNTYVPYSTLNYLLMYRDSLQKIHAEWVYLKPTLNWLNGDRANYQGSIVVKDWNGATLKIYNYGISKINQSNKISAVKGSLMSGQPTTPLKDGCLIWPVKIKCNCNAAWPSGFVGTGQWIPDKCDYCDGCVDYYCMIEPECGNCPPPPDWGGGTGGNGGNTGGNGSTPGNGNGGGSGGTNPGDYEPEDCTNGEQVVYPDGSMTPPACVPEPQCGNCPPITEPGDFEPPIDPLAQVFSDELGRMITFGEVSQAFESDAALTDLIEGELDFSEHGNPWFPGQTSLEVFTEYHALKVLHPQWTKLRLATTAYWNIMSGQIHFALDIAGLVPVIGEVADLANGGIYYLEGNKLDAALSVGSAIPVWGWVSTGGKWVKVAISAKPIGHAISGIAFKAVKTTKGTFRFIKIAANTFSHSALRALKAVKPADNTLTNLSRQLIDQAGQRIAPTLQSLKTKIDDIAMNGDDLGTKTEALCDDIFETNGFVKHDAKIGSNNGFDGVYIKKDASSNVQEIIINEAKPIKTTGNIKLNPRNDNTLLPAQMSDAWINNIITKLDNQGGNLSTLASVLEANKSKITKTVTGVDKATKEIVVLKLASY
jgi:hypothetical protein